MSDIAKYKKTNTYTPVDNNYLIVLFLTLSTQYYSLWLLEIFKMLWFLVSLNLIRKLSCGWWYVTYKWFEIEYEFVFDKTT